MGGGTVFPFCALSCAAVAKELCLQCLLHFISLVHLSLKKTEGFVEHFRFLSRNTEKQQTKMTNWKRSQAFYCYFAVQDRRGGCCTELIQGNQ